MRLISAFVFLLLLFTNGAMAEEQFTHCTIEPFDLPDDPPYPSQPPDPKFNACVLDLPIKRMHPDWADSDCIGSLESPVCTVETLMACHSLVRLELCEKLGIDYVKPTRKPTLLKYRIVRIQEMRSEDFHESARDLPWAQDGVWNVDSYEVRCDLDGTNCREFPAEAHRNMYTRVLRKSGGEWEIFDWYWWISE